MASKYVSFVVDVGGTERTWKIPLHKFDATTDPTVNDDSDDGYSPGSVWVNQTGSRVFACRTAGVGAADWAQIDAAGGTVDAADVTYTPTTLSDWTGSADPGNADDAFDQIAGRVTTLEGTDHAAVTVSGSYDYITLSGQDIVRGQVDVGTDLTALSSLTENTAPDSPDLLVVEVGGAKRKVDVSRFVGGYTATEHTVPNYRDLGSGRMTLSQSDLAANGTDGLLSWPWAIQFTTSDTVNLAAGSNDDVAIDARTILELAPAASCDLTGMVPTFTSGRFCLILNTSALYTVTIKHEATSTAANRFVCPGATDYTLPPESGVVAIYTSSRWQLLTKQAGSGYSPGGTDVALADGGTGASLTDPNADRIMFWDDSAGQVTWLTAGSGLSISTTTITATAASDSAAGISEYAVQSEMEAASSNTLTVTPGRTVYHPGVAKGFVRFNGTGTISNLSSYNVTSLTDLGTGYYRVNWSITFSSTTVQATQVSAGLSGTRVYADLVAGSQITNVKAEVAVSDTSHTLVDPDIVCVTSWGDL